MALLGVAGPRTKTHTSSEELDIYVPDSEQRSSATAECNDPFADSGQATTIRSAGALAIPLNGNLIATPKLRAGCIVSGVKDFSLLPRAGGASQF